MKTIIINHVTGTEEVVEVEDTEIEPIEIVVDTTPTLSERVANTEIDVVTLEETIDTIFGGM